MNRFFQLLVVLFISSLTLPNEVEISRQYLINQDIAKSLPLKDSFLLEGMLSFQACDTSACIPIVQDLNHLCDSSAKGAIIYLDLLPISSNTKTLINKKKINLINFFSKGDDYQILFTSKPKYRSKIKSLAKETNTRVTKIGSITKNKGIKCKYNDDLIKIDVTKMGYIHNF